MKHFFTTIACLFFVISSFATNYENCTVSLLTCDPGPDVYARFGHTAIRIFDPEQYQDKVFHYGVFDFSSDHFIARFVKGETDYQLGLLPFRYFMPEYEYRNSTVYEQVLNLTTDEKEKICTALEENYLPENRFYRYNFIYDNCATRPFNLIVNSQNEKVSFYLEQKATTYRTIIEEYVGYNNWLRFGIDLVVSSLADKPISDMETIAFPLYTKKIIDNTTKTDSLGNEKPLVSEENILFQSQIVSNSLESPFLLSPIFAMQLLCILAGCVLFYFEIRKKKHYIWVDFGLFTAVGLVGCIIFFLMFFSEHPVVKENYNLLWSNPLLLVAAICLFLKPTHKALRIFFIFYCFACIAALIVMIFNVQIMHTAFVPLIATLILRAISFSIFQKK